MARSAFGIDHLYGVLSKADAMGTREAVMSSAHEAGEHAGKSLRHCPKCVKEAAGAARTISRAG